MSEYHVVETVFKDREVLVSSLLDMGYEAEVHNEAKPLHGYKGDEREQKAHVIIPRSQVGPASNDVGFEYVDGAYIMHASEYDNAWRTGEKIKKLKQSYAENAIKKTVRSMANCTFFSKKNKANGQVEIQLRWL